MHVLFFGGGGFRNQREREGRERGVARKWREVERLEREGERERRKSV